MGNKNIKLLAIDDNQDNLTIVKALIAETFPEIYVLTALNGPDGLRLAEEEVPDVILLDIVMPEMDGFEVCKKLKNNPTTNSIPVVFITAINDESKNRVTALECGGEAFLAKPINESELTAQIRAMLKIRTAALEKENEAVRLSALVKDRTRILKSEIEARKKSAAALKKISDALKQQNELFSTLLKLLPVGVFMVDSEDGKPLVANEMAMKLLGQGILSDTNEPNLEKVYKTFQKNTKEPYPTSERPIVLGMKGITSHIDDMIVERSDGAQVLLEVFGTPVADATGNNWASLVTFMDITERKEFEDKLIYLSYHDPLTGVYNRRFFEEELHRLDAKQNFPLSIIMADINGLKLINDSFGHEVGDALLARVADAIQASCREQDVVARLGGDEFVVLLPNTSLSDTGQIAMLMKEVVAQAKIVNIHPSISFGYDAKVEDSQSILEILANSENHMFQHKLYDRASVRNKTIDIIMNTLFEKSSRELMHSKRVSKLCEMIAIQMDFGENKINELRTAGMVHDIGKMGISEKILNKKGSLTPAEWKEIQRHPESGWRILSSSNDFSKLAQFVLYHHEKWDGTGYPNGIHGEEIPIEARIITIADSFDAMTSHRSYRDGISYTEAAQEILRCAGTQFDPVIAKIFVDKVLIGLNNESFDMLNEKVNQ